MKIFFYLLMSVPFFLTENAGAMGQGRNLPDPQVVSQVDFNRYQGKWFEVAHSPNHFQKSCLTSTAEYQIIEPGKISVYNTCYKADGSTSDIIGVATIPNPAVPAKLKVRFGKYAKGDYWIVELDPNYQWAVVSGPGKKYNFILSRTASMPADQLNTILQTLKTKGFDTSVLIFDKY